MTDYKPDYNYEIDEEFRLDDLANRRLYLTGEIDNDTVANITYHIFRYNKEDEGLDISERKPIVLFINSCGGDISCGLSVCSAVYTSETPVNTVNIGRADSMAFLIYILGYNRYTLPFSDFMLHEGSYSDNDSFTKVADRLNFYINQLTGLQKDIILECTKIDEETYLKHLRKEWFMLAREAKDLGVCDYIIGYDCTMNDIYNYTDPYDYDIEKENGGEEVSDDD